MRLSFITFNFIASAMIMSGLLLISKSRLNHAQHFAFHSIQGTNKPTLSKRHNFEVKQRSLREILSERNQLLSEIESVIDETGK